ncbi:uncharacterized protein LOC143285752 [Babylonia areolata]|uniref:uncharacterized protein LOC143285752 n=1 Tax=Babylonia areolata TaxID=304850 RepID=UPI003FCF6E7C
MPDSDASPARLLIICFIPFLVIGTSLLAATVAAPYWYQYQDVDDQSVHMGLWKACVVDGDWDVCFSTNDIPNISDWIKVPQVLECISLTCAATGLLLCFPLLFRPSFGGACVIMLLTSFATLPAVGGFAYFVDSTGFDGLLWCFYVNVTGTLFLWAPLAWLRNLTEGRRGYQNI